MEFRLAGPGDEAVKWLWDYCFEKKGHPFFEWYFSRYCRESNVLAGYDGGAMAACLHLSPCDLALRGTVLPASYIVGVGVAPEARSGGAGALLTESLAEMRRRRHWVSIIMPARAGAYYPYQWELCYHQLHYAVPVGQLAAVGAKRGACRLLAAPEVAALDGVYRRFVAGRHGHTLRGEAYWRQIFEEQQTAGGYVYLLENAGEAEGYVFYKLDGGRLLVRELAYTGRQAQLGLMWFLYQHRSQVGTVEWNAPVDDWLHFVLPDPRRVVSLEPFMSARLVDAAQALAAIGYPDGADACLELDIEDGQAPWNNRRLTLTVANGLGQVDEARARAASPVRCGIGALSQLVFGRLSAGELAAMGRLKADADALARLEQLFPKCANYINEYY